MPRAAASTSRCSRRCRSRWCAASARARRGDRRAAPRPRRRPAHSACRCEAIDGDGRVERVRLGDGTRDRRRRRGRRRSASCPTTDWLEGSGLTLDNGVVCDETLPRRARRRRAGDVAPLAEPAASTASSMRLEHWTNATEQGVHAAAARCSRATAARRRSRRCRSCGPTSTTARSRASGASAATTASSSSTGPPTTTGSSRSSGVTAGSSASLGFSQPRHVMQYRRLIAEPRLVRRGARARRRESLRCASGRERFITPQFALVTLSGALYFIALGDAHAGAARSSPGTTSAADDIAVGIAVGAFAVGAVRAAPVRGPHRRPVGPPPARDRRRRRRVRLDGALPDRDRPARAHRLPARSAASARPRSSSAPRR